MLGFLEMEFFCGAGEVGEVADLIKKVDIIGLNGA